MLFIDASFLDADILDATFSFDLLISIYLSNSYPSIHPYVHLCTYIFKNDTHFNDEKKLKVFKLSAVCNVLVLRGVSRI